MAGRHRKPDLPHRCPSWELVSRTQPLRAVQAHGKHVARFATAGNRTSALLAVVPQPRTGEGT